MSSVFSIESNSSEMSEESRGKLGAWRGGPCPTCGDDMPANLVHCQTCRALLNSELTEDSVEIPAFIPLKELDPSQIARPQGHYISCPGCQEELRINGKYAGAAVACRFCNCSFTYDETIRRVAMYTTCPACRKELRAAVKYIGESVACRFCQGQLLLAD